MPNSIGGKRQNETQLAVTHYGPANLPQTATANLFSAVFGSVRLVALVGRVTTTIGATATNLTISGSGPAGTQVFGTATAITNLVAGTLIGPVAPGSALTTGGAIAGPTGGFVLGPANAGITITTSGSTTGQIEWFALWEPLHPSGELITLIGGPRGMKTRTNLPTKWVRRVTGALPQTAQAPIFTVRGGPARILFLVGLVTTATSATATNLTLVGNQTAAGVADAPLNTATAIASLAVGSYIVYAGIGAALATGNAPQGLGDGPIVDVGTIDALTSASNPGQIEWQLLYLPLHQGSKILPIT